MNRSRARIAIRLLAPSAPRIVGSSQPRPAGWNGTMQTASSMLAAASSHGRIRAARAPAMSPRRIGRRERTDLDALFATFEHGAVDRDRGDAAARGDDAD